MFGSVAAYLWGKPRGDVIGRFEPPPGIQGVLRLRGFRPFFLVHRSLRIMPFPWGKSSLKSTSNQETHKNVAKGAHSSLRASSKSLPSDLSTSSSCKSNRIGGTQTKLVPDYLSTSTPLSQPSSFTAANKGHPLPRPNTPSAITRADTTHPETTAAYVNNELLFRLPSPSEVTLRNEGRDGDGATSGNGSGSTSSYSSLSSTEMPDLQNGHREKSIFVLRLKSESEAQDSKHRNNFNMLQAACVSSCTSGPGQTFSLISRNAVMEKTVLAASPKRSSGGGKTALDSHEYQENGSVCSTANSLLSSPRLSPKRDYCAGQSYPSTPAAMRNFEHTIKGTVSISSSRSQQSPHSLPPGDFAGLSTGQPGRISQDCSPLTSPTMPRNKAGSNSGAPSSVVSPMHPAASGFWLDSATSSLDDSRIRNPLSMAPSKPSEHSPYASPPVPSSPRSLQSRGLSRSENTANCTSQWQKGKLLGSGTFGNVYKGFSDTGTFCAMKEVLVSDDPRSKESVKQLSQEIQVLSQLRHPNIVQYISSEFFEDRLYIYLEYVSGGSIHKLLQEYGRFKEPAIRNYTRQILCGLAYLHSMQTVHRDIKGANILVNTNGEVKLADFGMAKHINSHSMPLSFKGSPYWMAPEVFKSTNGYDYPVDIWSLGCTIIEMATAKPPWSQYEGIAALFKIGNSKEVPMIPESLSNIGKEFVKLCLRRDPADRPSAVELLEHPFARFSADFIGVEANHGYMTSNAASSYYPQDDSFEVRSPGVPQSSVTLSPSSEFMQPQIGHVSPMASPCSSPKLQQRIPYQTYGAFSPSPISSPLIGSGSSTPCSAGYRGQLLITTPLQSTVRSSLTDNYGIMSRRPPDNVFAGSPGRYVGPDVECSDPNRNLRLTHTSEGNLRNGMYRFV